MMSRIRMARGSGVGLGWRGAQDEFSTMIRIAS